MFSSDNTKQPETGEDEDEDGSHAGGELGRAPSSSPKNRGVAKMRSMYYDQDGQPIEGGTLAWAELFENANSRIIGQTRTLYGEKLSTVWLGLNHNFGEAGPPLIFETMLFAPDPENVRRRAIHVLAELAKGKMSNPKLQAVYDSFEAIIRKYYPHDQLQIRYSTKGAARASFERLRRQCLIPPRLRRFILYTILKDDTWS